MSMWNDGREVRCDGAACPAKTRWPIALHPMERAAPPGAVAERPAAGWLSVSGSHRPRHFCPLCAASFLHSIANDLPGARRK